MPKAVIIGGAPVLDYKRARSFIDENDYVIFCDSGLAHSEKLGIKPNLIIGDFDSHENPHSSAETIVLPHMKDDTDTDERYLRSEKDYERKNDAPALRGIAGTAAGGI